MLNQREIIEYAIKGINADIDALEKTVNEGKRHLLAFAEGKPSKTPKTEYEVREIIREKRAEIERLAKIEQDLKWKLYELEESE